MRTVITTPTTFNVNNVTGVDAPGAVAWRTIQYAVDTICRDYDFQAQPTIRLAATGVPYAEAVILRRWVGSLDWCNGVYSYPCIQGDPANPTAVVVRPANGWAFTGVNCSPWIIDSLSISSPNGGGINSDAYSHILGRSLDFGQVGAGPLCCQILAQHGAFYEHIATPFTISGGGWTHAYAHLAGMIKLQSPCTVAINNAPRFSYFAICDGNSIIDYSGIGYSGGLWGNQYVPVVANTGGFMSPPPSAPPWP